MSESQIKRIKQIEQILSYLIYDIGKIHDPEDHSINNPIIISGTTKSISAAV